MSAVTRSELTRRREAQVRWAALLVVALGFGLRVAGLGRESLWYDELLQLDIAQGPLDHLAGQLRGHSAVPLDYVITHFWIGLGRSEAWVRWPAALIGTLTLPAVYQLGRALVKPVDGLLLMLLLAVSPFHVRYSQEVRPYALVVLGVTLAVAGCWRLGQTGRWRYALLVQVGVAVLSLAHIFAVTLVASLLLWLGLAAAAGWQRGRLTRVAGALLLSFILPLLVYLWMGWLDALYYSFRQFGAAVIQLEGGSGQPAVAAPFGVDVAFVWREMVAPLTAAGPLAGLMAGLAALGGVYLLATRRAAAGWLLLLWLLLPPLLVVSFLQFRQEFFAPRYVITILPAYLLLLAVGLLAGPRWLYQAGYRRAGLAALLLALGLAVGQAGLSLRAYYRQPVKENWRLVAGVIARNAAPDDAVMAMKAEPALNWYYPPAAARPNQFDDLDSIRAAVAHSRRSWVVLSIFSADDDAQVKAWLSEQRAIRLPLEPLIHVYYLGPGVSHEQLLTEIQGFALPVDHALYASLARENRRRPEVARQYYQLALEHAPTTALRQQYRAAMQED